MFDYEYWGNVNYTSQVNMALEEFFLRKAAQKAIVRFYSFPKDSAILGYAQATDVIKVPNFDFTRRITGGSHVQVGSNVICYSFAVPRDGSFKNYEDMRTYFAEHVANGLSDLGIENVTVDNKASTISVDGKVVASHAIIWGVKSALLHGLLIVDPYDVDKLASHLALQSRKVGNKIYQEYTALKNIPAVSKLLNGIAENADESVRGDVLKDLITKAVLKQVSNGRYENKQIKEKDVSEAVQLLNRKFNLSPWTDKHKPTFTKEEVEAIPGEDLDGTLKKNLGYCMFLQVKNKDFKRMAQTEV